MTPPVGSSPLGGCGGGRLWAWEMATHDETRKMQAFSKAGHGRHDPVAGGRIVFLGHATTLIELDGTRVVTDPVLRRQVGPLYRRVPPPLTRPLADPAAILLSHLHLDHYDPVSLRMFRRDTLVLAPVGARRSLQWRGFRDIHEMAPGDRLRVGSLEIVATPARHRGTRHPLAARTPSLGYVVSGSRSIYFAGDTGLFPGMADLWDGLDVALLPIAGLGPWMPEFKHLSPRHAVRAAELLRPRLVIPIHWGTYHLPGTVIMRMRPDVHRRAPLVFIREVEALAPEIRTVMLDPGESLDLAQALPPLPRTA
jgi:L-ascorbate metabolism protein UlaG (beta-lactamase superfamily)